MRILKQTHFSFFQNQPHPHNRENDLQEVNTQAQLRMKI